MAKKIGIYICSGCDIGKSIDIEKLSQVAAEQKVNACKNHTSLCSVEGIDLINNDISTEALNGIIIAACSPRAKTEIFDFPENIILERTNLREQVAWSFEPNDENTQMAAEDYLRMSITKVNNIEVPKPFIAENISSVILVVGGGITGITSAIEGAKAGYTIHIIEKEEKLGGWLNKLHKQIPYVAPYNTLIDSEIEDKIKELEQFENIKIHTSTTIIKIDGQPGKFEVFLSVRQAGLQNSKEAMPDGRQEKITVGSIVTSTGWNPYDANKLSHLGYGIPNVLTNVEFEELVKNNPDKALPKNILFIQCAGSRDKDHLPYCSSFCCGTSLKQAKYIRDLSPESNVFVVYKDIRTLGLYEEFYKEVQKDDQIFFTKGEIEEITENDKSINVNVKDTLIGENISLSVDMIVLATGMVPNGTEVLNLNYQLGKGLPELKYNFSDSHFICFPYETRRTGIYAAGSLRAPMDIASSKEDATGAMLKAIQTIEATKRGEAVHPRSGDKSYPELYLDRCTDCKRCTEECPFGAYDENEKGTPIQNPNRCRRCGICVGSCPERVISFADYSINSVSAMIKSVEIPDEFEEKPRILVFVCENDAYPAMDMAGQKGLKYSSFIRVIPVRCIGSVNKVWISDALSQGFDGILQIGCKPGDDYQCHFIQGSELTETRGVNIQETLETMMLEPERIRTEFIEITDYHKIPEIINDYVEEIELIGPNPFKDM
ncbi:MAG: hydrogenase iron-sulfur subunit [Bacteroidales bacterium]|jgi:quinone-modifying oxidoreductase subunit QmoB|nr:hydrogenase iron-sulfur subunit [Bacteroidales bacterium]